MEPKHLIRILPRSLSPDLYEGKALVRATFSRTSLLSFSHVDYQALVNIHGVRGLYSLHSQTNSRLISVFTKAISDVNIEFKKDMKETENEFLTKSILDSVEAQRVQCILQGFETRKQAQTCEHLPSKALDSGESGTDMSNSSTCPGQTALRKAEEILHRGHTLIAVPPDKDYWSTIEIKPIEPICVLRIQAGLAEPPSRFHYMLSTFRQFQVESIFFVHQAEFSWHSNVRHLKLLAEARSKNTIVFFDGSCSLCRVEIAHYQRLAQKHSSQIEFFDVSKGMGKLNMFHVSFDQAMARLHVVDQSGQLHTGARAFVQIWQQLPYWQYLAKFITTIPFAVHLTEGMYKIFAQYRLKWKTT
jgi:predicted DCC family thiol-disulfide oxidoreductase YuxK